MNGKTIRTMGIAALAAAVAAFFASRGGDGSTEVAGAEPGTALFPELNDDVNAAARVTVTQGDESFTVEREGDAWGSADKDGYPVSFDQVKKVVVGISELTIVEPKTKNPANHSKLGVQAPDEEDSMSRRVTIEDASGATVADVILGETRPSRGLGRPTMYVRRADEDQAWEVAGRVTVDGSLANWLDRKIVSIDGKRVRSVLTTHPDGEVLKVEKEKPSDNAFMLVDHPPGRELAWPGVTNGIGGALQHLSLEDVAKRETVDFDSLPFTTTVFSTFDGLVVTARIAEKDEKSYLTLEASYDGSQRYVDVSGPDPAPPEEGATLEMEEEVKPVEEVQAEVEEINSRVGPWAYVIPGYSATNMTKRNEDMLKKLPDPPPPAEEDDEAPLASEDDAAEGDG